MPHDEITRYFQKLESEIAHRVPTFTGLDQVFIQKFKADPGSWHPRRYSRGGSAQDPVRLYFLKQQRQIFPGANPFPMEPFAVEIVLPKQVTKGAEVGLRSEVQKGTRKYISIDVEDLFALINRQDSKGVGGAHFMGAFGMDFSGHGRWCTGNPRNVINSPSVVMGNPLADETSAGVNPLAGASAGAGASMSDLRQIAMARQGSPTKPGVLGRLGGMLGGVAATLTDTGSGPFT